MEFLFSLDKSIFLLINHQMSHPWLDVIMSTLTNLHNEFLGRYILLPALLLIWFWRERQRALKILLPLIVLIGISDGFCYRILKPAIARPRPNHMEELNSVVKIPHRPTSYSFPSNHAVSTFAVAYLLRFYYPPLTGIFYLVAGLVGFSRIYVGVHFPSDVIGGALIGLAIGQLFVWCLRRLRYTSVVRF